MKIDQIDRSRWYRAIIENGEVTISGIDHAYAVVVTEDRLSGHIVIAFRGRSENWGSRYSDLRNYSPAETYVFAIEFCDGNRYTLSGLIGWESRSKKTVNSFVNYEVSL